MDVRKAKFDSISKKLTYLQQRVTNNNSLNLTDVNIHAENFFRDLLKLLGYTFTNSNFDDQNSAYIDLIDYERKIAIQITAQNDSGKITESLNGFYKNPKYYDFKLQVLLISKDAKDYTTKFGNNFNHKEDVIDIKRLLAIIHNKTTPELLEIERFLDKEVQTERLKTESTEVETIMALINYLSKPENRSLAEKKDNIDPEYKINKRFSEHATYLIGKYSELMPVYYSALQVARRGLDDVMSLIISSYLKDESDVLLNKHNNNPREALDDLVNFFHGKLSENGFKTFDKQAIRFYLLEEMIKCNVFPNN
ncbi:SMEK domain-containing protein [Pedobacter sp. HMF7647]|uniref:SMEK domain-containing protein n=1 Tax=Hufsiella arboris TaxID=2695275 RepID=A0A7K1Y4L8_9SPHI|nr:SMEK domain-containing protein [Hufsiella arboris]MXV49514.1 SMEK domain-containing protein [Hufsiella arboris]